MLCDARLQDEISTLIRERHYSAEYAVSRTLRRYAKVFQRIGRSSISPSGLTISSTSKNDCCTICWAAQREDLAHLRSPVIVVAHDLTPSETANLNPKFVRGFATEIGGPGGHTAIVAEALGDSGGGRGRVVSDRSLRR